MKRVAITTACLAVLTAIAAARGTACVSKTQLLTATEGSQWSYYQAKSIKENLAETQKNAFEVQSLGVANAEQKAAYESKLQVLAQEIARYGQEKAQIKKDAEDTGVKNKLLARKNIFFSAAVVFLQIAIMLSSVSALLRRKSMWVTGMVFGAVGLVLLGYGLFLEPLLF